MSFNDKIMVVIDATSNGAVKEMDRLQRSTKEADKGVAALGKTLKTGLVAGAAAFAGAGLVSFLNDSVTAYSDAAKKAGELAKATGGTVANVSRMTAALQDNGVSAEQTAALLSKFTATVGKNDALLGKYGVTLKKNADGSADYADAMVQVIDNISKIGDASQRQAALTEVFGKKQAAVFQELAASGVSLSDAMAAVSKYRVFSEDDVARAVAYDDAMDKLGGSVQGLQFALGEALVPALSVTADALAEVVEFMSGIPVEVYAAVGAFVALKGASKFIGPLISDLALASTGLGAAGPKLASLAASAGKFIGVAAAVTAVVEAFQAWQDVKDASVSLDNVTLSLEQQAVQLNKTDSLWRTLVVGNNVQKSMESITKALRDQAQATLDNANATDTNKAAAQRLIDQLGQGTLEQQTANLATEEGRRAQEAYAVSLSESAAAALAAENAQRDLNDTITAFLNNDPSVTWQDITTAAQGAAEAQGLVAEATRIAAEQMAIATGDVGFFIDALQRLDNIGGSSVESLKADLEGISFTDVAGTWANEALIGAEQAYDTLVGGLKRALETNPQLDLTAWLEQFRGLSPELDAVITQVLADISTDKKIQAALGITEDGTVAETQAKVDALGKPVATTFDLSTGEGVAAAKANKDELAKPVDTTITFATKFDPGGYEAVKARKDYLVQDRTGNIGINVAFSPGGYEAAKARADYLSQARSGSITIAVRLSGTAAAIAAAEEAAGQSISVGAGAAAASRSANMMFSPINMVRVSLDGRELRSVIDDEIRALTPTTQEVA
jgi:hypothetical protein